MRLQRTLLFILAASAFVRAEDIAPRFARSLTISYTPPNPTVWKVAERDEQEDRGMIMYKREAIVDEKGLRVEPCLAIVYSKLPKGIQNLIEFSIAVRTKIPYEITRMSQIEDGAPDVGRAVVFWYTHLVEDCEHTGARAVFFEEGLGVQAVLETTTSVLKVIEADQDAFFRSVTLKKK